jgi:Protein of unknown function (DUF3788)
MIIWDLLPDGSETCGNKNHSFMDSLQLTDETTFPGNQVLENVLGDSYPVYQNLLTRITGEDFQLVPEWHYYKDGKAWLCKVSHKKKTVFWLSVWNKFFKITFYFTAKHFAGIEALGIKESIKIDFLLAKPVGKLCPLTILMKKQDQVTDVLALSTFKLGAK